MNVEQPIGIEFHVQYMLSLLNLDAMDVRFVGIWGMSGIGKTTIVKAVYERIFNKFTGSSFLEDVKEHATKRKDLVILQRQLASRILKKKIKMEISNVSEGSTFIKKRMEQRKVLIILDDVNNDDQIKALAGDTNWFGKGSRIIITTTCEDILTRNKVDRDRIYKPQLLDEEQSLQLFSRHAFLQDQPLDGFLQLSCEMVKCAQGLPLALGVLGSSLIDNNSIKKWKSELKKYERIPHGDIHKTLKISFEELTLEQQSVFLDIACFFNGVDKRIAFYYWESLDLHPQTEFPVLIRRSLVKIVDEKKIWMHNQLQSMGRRIVYEENPKDPAKRSRLWKHKEVMEVLKEMGCHNIEGILLNFEKNIEDSLSSEDFKSVSKLRLLNVNGSGLKGDFKHFPPRLRCLFWQRCNFDMPPTDFHHEELVILDLSHSNTEEAWKYSPQNKEFKELKVLNLSECSCLVRTPDFSRFPNLERLILEGCCELVDIHESIGILKGLVYLDLRSCSKLKELPGKTFQLTALKNLVLTGCKSLENLPESFGCLKSLVKLSLNSTHISKLPDALGLLEKLEILNAMDCIYLVKLPRTMAKMRRLQHINFSRTGIESLPDDFLMLSSLVKLELAKCRKLQCFPEDRQQGYSGSGLCKLQVLNLEHCKKLESIPKLSSSLCKLNVIGCSSLHKYDDFSNLKNLKELFFGQCNNMVDMPSGFGKLSSLDKLVLSLVNCDSLPPNPISGLRHLALVECQKLVSLPELPSSLMRLHLHSCHSLERLPNLSNLKILEELKLEGCEKITEIQGLEQLKFLRLYEVTSCHHLTVTTKKVQGQGTLKDESYELHGDVIHTEVKIGDNDINMGLVMGLAISYSRNTNQYLSGVFDDCMLQVAASILRNGRRIHCRNDLLIKVHLIDVSELFIYIHYFEGCKWFGLPLQRGDVIEAVMKLDYIQTWNLKFFHLSVLNNEDMHPVVDQQPRFQKVEDFFNWIDKDDEFEETTQLTLSTLRLYRTHGCN
ncbi:disease resistance protein RUN1-like [Macadamia integrifolia]|uniref:disease resistance protein RUN1-like n=1 Tax=Macadamia integrifolia TaxID=60698 RepID=UPI001C4EB8A5|nr:disease resistance protein RUN1-like [Macadamia integrifolia]XP_042518757.1 disease resistance protein RUN1-like [Macadamia integrifolia]XP_042518779.1 disease resistance protein RUN1-like [Macadamia integrifolia]XP_042518844.1 disease resistance protein RUN1-like [Macadamia integrifolia]